MQGDLEQWIQRRFWILAFLAVVVGFFGTRSLVRELISEELKTATQSAADARAAADHAKESTRDVRQQADRYRDRVEALSGDAARLDDKLKSLDQRIAAEGAHALAAAEIRIGELAEQLQELSGTVQHLSAQSTESRRIVQDYRERVAKLQSTASNAMARFNENSAINVVVLHPMKDTPSALGPRVLATLLKQGYKAAEAFANSAAEELKPVRIDYKNGRRQNGEEVRAIVASLIGASDPYAGDIVFEERSAALGDPMDVRVFL
jgi:phage shock protein A